MPRILKVPRIRKPQARGRARACRLGFAPSPTSFLEGAEQSGTPGSQLISCWALAAALPGETIVTSWEGCCEGGRGRSGHCPVSAASGGGESERDPELHCGRCYAGAGGGLRSFPARPHATSLWLGAAVGAAEGAGPSLLPLSPPASVHPHAPPPQLPSHSAPCLPGPPHPPRLRRPSGAARLQLTGLESRLGAPDSRPPARPLPPPPPAPRPPRSPPPPPSSGAQAQPPPPLPPSSSAASAAEHHGRRRERAQQSAQPAAPLSLRLLGVSAGPGGGAGGGRGRGGLSRPGLGRGGPNPGGWAPAGPTGRRRGPSPGRGAGWGVGVGRADPARGSALATLCGSPAGG